MDQELPIFRFVITGGPCGGKTTALFEMRNFLRENGFRVFVAQEAATILLTHGADSKDFANPACAKAFQQFVINTQLQLEDSIAEYARCCKEKSVLLCDRGIMDGAAYVSKEMWSSVLAEKNMDTISAREGRYNAVFHLVTAANGAESHYTLDNNAARHETAEEAIVADNNTQAAWHGHPHHIIIDNRNGRSFDEKLSYLKSVMASYVGITGERHRNIHKYKLQSIPDVSAFPEHTEVFDVEKIMLNGDEITADDFDNSPSCERVLYSFLRKRSQGGSHAYGLTQVKKLTTGDVVQLKRIITPQMYSTLLLTRRDPKRHIVKERRYCFRADHQSVHVSHWIEPDSLSGWFAVIQCESEPIVPSYLNTGPELSSTPTNGDEYSFRILSLRGKEERDEKEI